MVKNAIIFGATSGIGRGLANVLVNNGYHVLVTGRRLAKLEEIKASNPERYSIKQHDITDIESSNQFFNDLPFTKVDLIVLSSGLAYPNFKLEYDLDLPILKTNVLGITKLLQLSYYFFDKQGYGHLVGISSVASIRGDRHSPAYFASKSYQSSYLESLWMKAYRSKKDITVSNILPGYIDTEMIPKNVFWKVPLNKACLQIYTAIQKKKKRAYISKRWRLIALFLRVAPPKMIVNYF